MDRMCKKPEEMIEILPESEKLKVAEFVKLGYKLGCRWQIRYAKANKYWRCVFSKKKPSRVLFTIECTEAWWRIKAMLSNLEEYKEELEECSDNIVESIKTAYDCHNCNDSCKGPKPFIIDGVTYKKCLGCSFYFENLNTDEQKSLIKLLEMEEKF